MTAALINKPMTLLMITATIHNPAPSQNHFQSALETYLQKSKAIAATNNIPIAGGSADQRFTSAMPILLAGTVGGFAVAQPSPASRRSWAGNGSRRGATNVHPQAICS